MILKFKLVDNDIQATHIVNNIQSKLVNNDIDWYINYNNIEYKLVNNNIDYRLTLYLGIHPEYLKLVELYSRGFLTWNSL